MKCIVYWEFCPEDIDKVIAKNMESEEIAEKDPDRFPKYLYPPQYTTQGKGFTLVEATQEQMTNGHVFWFPEMSLTFVPCDDVSNWIEVYLNTKK